MMVGRQLYRHTNLLKGSHGHIDKNAAARRNAHYLGLVR